MTSYILQDNVLKHKEGSVGGPTFVIDWENHTVFHEEEKQMVPGEKIKPDLTRLLTATENLWQSIRPEATPEQQAEMDALLATCRRQVTGQPEPVLHKEEGRPPEVIEGRPPEVIEGRPPEVIEENIELKVTADAGVVKPNPDMFKGL